MEFLIKIMAFCGLGLLQVACQNSGQNPPAYLRPQGTTNWADLGKWERKEYPLFKASVELPKDRSGENLRNYEGINETVPTPKHSDRGLSFNLHQASAGFLMEPQSKISVFFEHYYPHEWREYLARERHTLSDLGGQPRGLRLRMIVELDENSNRYQYRRDYKLPDGSVVIAHAYCKLIGEDEERRGRPDAEDDAAIRRILNSLRPL